MSSNDPRVLLVTNDFPPAVGGIQTYLNDFVGTLDPSQVVVFASTQDRQKAHQWDASAPFTVVRWPRKVMLPTPATARRMQEIIRQEQIDVVWFGASTPLGLMGSAARAAGARRVVASTHGHEIGWSMIPVARRVLRLIGNRVDVLTYVSEYAHGRIKKAFGPRPRFEPLQPGVDLDRFHPDPAARARVREQYQLKDRPVVVCISRIVPRKGQDTLVECLPRLVKLIPDVVLMIVGPGDDRQRLAHRAQVLGVADSFLATGPVPFEQLPDFYNAGDVFAMPVRTLGKGLDVEGLGIVFLEAQACGVPVVAGDGGGAPETVRDGRTGIVVDGRNETEVVAAVASVLKNRESAREMGLAGRNEMEKHWSWSVRGPRLGQILFNQLD